MLSYQHQYHAGNHADVLKHWGLLECLAHILKKPKPFDYIDTHAGAGSYRLDSFEARKTGEYLDGIGKLMTGNWPGLESYLDLVRKEVVQLRYPGSPEIVNRMMRANDHSWLHELHPQTIERLREHCAGKHTYVRAEDGLAALEGLLPVASRRALALIDPSYEIKTEYDTVFKSIVKAWHKMPQTVFVLWYPVVERERIDRLERRFRTSALRDVQLFEMGVADDNTPGMSASGLIVVNPPWTLRENFLRAIPAVSAALSTDGITRTRHEVLSPE